jgi:hypothetical protein
MCSLRTQRPQSARGCSSRSRNPSGSWRRRSRAFTASDGPNPCTIRSAGFEHAPERPYSTRPPRSNSTRPPNPTRCPVFSETSPWCEAANCSASVLLQATSPTTWRRSTLPCAVTPLDSPGPTGSLHAWKERNGGSHWSDLEADVGREDGYLKLLPSTAQ